MTVLELVCWNMERIRKAKGLSQETVADRMDMDQGHYSRLEKGGTNPTLATLVRIADVGLQCGIDDLFVQPEHVMVHEGMKRLLASGPRKRAGVLKLLDISSSMNGAPDDEKVKHRKETLQKVRKKD